MTKKIVIYRGIPGAGKTEHIRTHYDRPVICSADHYFIVNGEYQFVPRLIGEAHNACMQKFLKHTNVHYNEQGQQCYSAELIVVDNTNVTYAEVSPYVMVGAARGYEVEVIRLLIHPDVAAPRNVHGVPAGGVHNMNYRMEKCPPFINETIYEWTGDHYQRLSNG